MDGMGCVGLRRGLRPRNNSTTTTTTTRQARYGAALLGIRVVEVGWLVRSLARLAAVYARSLALGCRAAYRRKNCWLRDTVPYLLSCVYSITMSRSRLFFLFCWHDSVPSMTSPSVTSKTSSK